MKNNGPEFGGCKLMNDVVQLGRWKHPTNTSLCPSLFFCPDGISKSWVRWFETLQMAKKTEEQLIKKVLEIAAEEQHHKAATL